MYRQKLSFNWPLIQFTEFWHCKLIQTYRGDTGHLQQIQTTCYLLYVLKWTPIFNLLSIRSIIPEHNVRTSYRTESCFIFNKLTKINIKSGGDAGKQSHHHNGDQAARRPHMMCLTCGRRPLCVEVRGDPDERIW